MNKKLLIIAPFFLIIMFFLEKIRDRVFNSTFIDFVQVKLIEKNLYKKLPPYLGPKPNEKSISKNIKITSNEIALKKRNELIKLIWGKEKLPLKDFQNIEKNYYSKKYSSLKEIKSIDKLSYVIDNNISSTAFLFTPFTSNNKAIIFHKGHADGGYFWSNKRTIKKFLKNGYTVVALSMPSLGVNEQRYVEIDNIGFVKLDDHNKYKYLDRNEDSSALKYFVEPVIYSINHLTNTKKFEEISLVGISGGARTIDLVSAIDERTKNSFSIAGPLPLELENFIYCKGNFYTNIVPYNSNHYEYHNEELLNIISVYDQFILSSYSPNKIRTYHQIRLSHESQHHYCDDRYKLYENLIKDSLSKLESGYFYVKKLTAYKHYIPIEADNYIIQFLK